MDEEEKLIELKKVCWTVIDGELQTLQQLGNFLLSLESVKEIFQHQNRIQQIIEAKKVSYSGLHVQERGNPIFLLTLIRTNKKRYWLASQKVQLNIHLHSTCKSNLIGTKLKKSSTNFGAR